MPRFSWLHPWAYRLVRWVLAAVFVVAGTLKLMDPAGFARIIEGYGLAPAWALEPLAYGLPALEVLVGLAVLADLPGSLEALAGLLVFFMAVLWFGILADLHVDCGCFSAEEQAQQDGLRQALIRDAWLLLAALYALLHRYLRRRQSGAGNHAQRRGYTCAAD